MNLFLRRIPASTKHADISEFVYPALKKGFFREPGRITNVEILALQDTRVGTIEYHGLVTLDSEDSVHHAVKRLKNRRLNGRLVLVRPYYHRSWSNDPRQQYYTATEIFFEKRKGDRRRGHYLRIIKNVSDRFNSEDDFFNTVIHQQLLINFMVPAEIKDAVEKLIADFEEEPASDEAVPAIPKHKPFRLLTAQNNDNQTYSFQVHTEKKESATLLEKLKSEFPGSGIQYWIVPVIEDGQI
ncbi:MAG: DUF3240 family protein [Methylomonas sp.]